MFTKTLKILEIVSKYPFKVCQSDTVTRSDNFGGTQQIDRIVLDNTEALANACSLGDVGYRHIIEIDSSGSVSLKSPLSASSSYKVYSAYDPFVERAFKTFDELKRGEHLEEQWDCEGASDSQMVYYKMISMKTYKSLYLQIMDGLIFVCTNLIFSAKDFENGWGAQDIIKDGVTKVASGAFGMRQVMNIYH